jgi:hypothetical protein
VIDPPAPCGVRGCFRSVRRCGWCPAAAGDGSGGSDAAVTFAFRLRGLPASEEFSSGQHVGRFHRAGPGSTRLARSAAPAFCQRAIRAGNGGHNLQWSWHFADAALVDAAVELCDGRPSMVEASLDYWLDT